MTTHYLFDIDGTLTTSRQPMDASFAKRFLTWSQANTFSLVSGSDIEKIKEQVPVEILNVAVQIFACNGNSIWKYDGSTLVNLVSRKLRISKALREFLMFELQYANWTSPRFEPHIEHRPGLVNFSILGRGAPQEWREKFQAWDAQDGTRMRQCNYINSKFEELHASVGGAISIDIVNKDGTKAQVLDHINLTECMVEFYGDKIDNGNDKPLAERINSLGCGFAKNVSGYEELATLLNIEEVPNVEIPAEQTIPSEGNQV
jgi:phosphomannomutase